MKAFFTCFLLSSALAAFGIKHWAVVVLLVGIVIMTKQEIKESNE